MKNTGILYIRMLVTLLVSLYTSRVVLEYLGIDDFGVYSVIGGVVGLFAFLSRTLTASFNRYICLGIAHDDEEEINYVFGASIVIQFLIIGIVLVLGETIGIWFINNYLNVAPEKLTAAHIVFQFSVATFIVNIFTSAYNSIVISYERMSVYAYLCVLESCAKLGVVYALSITATYRLELYSGLRFGIQLLVLIFYYIFIRRRFYWIKPIIKNCKPYVQHMMSFAGYGFIGSFAFVVKNQGLNFLLNIFGGPALNAARAVSFQVYTAVYNFVGNFQTAFSPYILKHQELDNAACNQDVKVFTALSFSIMSFLIIPIIFCVNEIIHLWLGSNVPPYTQSFTNLVLIIGLCEAISSPLQNIIYGSGKIKALQIGAFIIQLIVLFWSMIELKANGDPIIVYIIDVSANIILILFRILVASRTTSLRLKEYFYQTFVPFVAVSIIISIIYFMSFKYSLSLRIVSIIISEIIIMIYFFKTIPTSVFFATLRNFRK